MKVREIKQVLVMISSACTSRHDWHGGTPGSSTFSDAHTRLGRVRPRRQKPFRHKYFHGDFAWRPHASWPCTQSGKVSLNPCVRVSNSSKRQTPILTEEYRKDNRMVS